MTYKLVLFDIDGPLVDSFPSYKKVMRIILPKFNSATTLEQLFQTFPMTMDETLQEYSISQNKIDIFRNSYQEELSNQKSQENLFSHTTNVLTLK